jgi:hypothetical protein
MPASASDPRPASPPHAGSSGETLQSVSKLVLWKRSTHARPRTTNALDARTRALVFERERDKMRAAKRRALVFERERDKIRAAKRRALSCVTKTFLRA